MDSRFVRRSVLICLLFCATAHVGPFTAMASPQTTGHQRVARAQPEAPDDVVVKEVHITLIRIVLKLRPTQEPYWVPVENALRDLAQWQADKAASTGAMASASARATANYVMRRLKRIAIIARPLLKSLDENQRRDLDTLVQLAGLEVLMTAR